MRSRGLIAAAVAAGLLVAPCEVQATQPVIIDNDHGGSVDAFAMWYNRLKDSGVPVRVRGLCVSACTLVFMLPKSQACVEPTASFGFHLASEDDEPDIEVSKAIVRRWYPEPVRRWLVGHTMTSAVIYMSAQEAVKLDALPACVPTDDSLTH